jgi:hypothetical protein
MAFPKEITALVVLIVLSAIVGVVIQRKKTQAVERFAEKCSPVTCGAIDPVNDPGYNVREVIKNTVLIEQHLAEKRKYCKECLVKHFLLSIGLLEEAVWMAACKMGKYPMLEESEVFYTGVFEEWRQDMDGTQTRLDTLRKLREWRQEMVRLYFFGATS